MVSESHASRLTSNMTTSSTGDKRISVVPRGKKLLDAAVTNKSKVGRGESLACRKCKVCLDCAKTCPLKLDCPCLTEHIKNFLLGVAQVDDEKDLANQLVSKIRSLADEDQHIRAQQITQGGLNTETQMMPIVREHRARLEKIAFLEKMLANRVEGPAIKQQAEVHLRDLQLSGSDLEQLCVTHEKLQRFGSLLADPKTDRSAAHADSELIDKFINRERFHFAADKERCRTNLNIYCRRNPPES